ncbi:hypothetical protein AgCh_001851 [Apium graveolens]
MSGNTHVYKAWTEKRISEDKGKRVLHYYLLSTSTSPLLAVVGTETNDRHYRYAVSEKYIEVFGSSEDINIRTTWTNRTVVKEWLQSLIKRLPDP